MDVQDTVGDPVGPWWLTCASDSESAAAEPRSWSSYSPASPIGRPGSSSSSSSSSGSSGKACRNSAASPSDSSCAWDAASLRDDPPCLRRDLLARGEGASMTFDLVRGVARAAVSVEIQKHPTVCHGHDASMKRIYLPACF